MIRYALKCAEGHRFESWFQSASAYDTLARAGHLACAVCGSAQVDKELMAPRVAAGETDGTATHAAPAKPPERPLSQPAHPAEQALARLRRHVEKNATYVGPDFARKAREIHNGEAPETAIYGEAAPAEAQALREEGVPVAPLPFRPTDKSN
jgi:hypothetical protein